MTPELTLANRMILILTLTLLLGAATCLGVAGCASQAELPPQITQNLVDLRDSIQQGKAQVQTTCNAARDLTQRPQGDLQAQIDRLTRSIAALDDLATNNRKSFASADEHAQAYFAQWDQQMQGMSQSLAEQGQQRRAESQASFAELKSRIQVLKQEFRPFMSSLLEVSKYLQTDTTASGVRIVTPQINTALDRENAIMAKADAVVAQIDAMRGGK
jgi:DNA repair exonuclease SbcCD ATPase subunit